MTPATPNDAGVDLTTEPDDRLSIAAGRFPTPVTGKRWPVKALTVVPATARSARLTDLPDLAVGVKVVIEMGG
ncbi:hypothetical protein [Pseudonocardia humida]|uniref:Uncharacterized protein n=1 Tax=Pseudonocardia humida TaxID=2800819 RepID=A0ABT1ACW1_9PSEU|nr:hypothetical protein [Pseudonocardia humida]MCO1660902.1 hypothetical protein [Pseudonocardia humida]